MQSFRSIQNKPKLFNYELNKYFNQSLLNIKKDDIEKSLKSIILLKEYIRYCYHNDYEYINKHNLQKYCKLLLQYEKSNRPILIKACHQCCKEILEEAMQVPITLKTMDVCFEFIKSNSGEIENLSNELMIYAIGTNVRGISF